MDGVGLREMFRGKAADGDYESWMRAFCHRKHNSDFAKEMSRSVAKYRLNAKSWGLADF